MLKYVLHIKNGDLLRQDCVVSMISPYIDKTKKPRLIEPPQAELKTVQKRMKTLLGKIQVPDNVFSGIKGRSYSDNARLHLGKSKRNLYKIDLTAFFPSISRETVYRFFFEDFVADDGTQFRALKNGNVWFVAIMLRGFEEVYAVDGDKRYLNQFIETLRYMWNHNTNVNKLFDDECFVVLPEKKKESKWLLTQAAMVEMYARLANYINK